MKSKPRVSPKSHRTRLKKRPQRLPLSIGQILQWADAHFAEHGKWPNVKSGYIPGTIDDTWMRMDNSLREGNRELSKNTGLTLARLLAKHRDVRNSEYPPLLTEVQIIKWAKLHYKRTGKWPKENSGPILDAVSETWAAIDLALRKGKRRGTPGGDSLPKFLNRCCGVPFGVRQAKDLPGFTINQIVQWAAAYVAQHGQRPNDHSGPIPEAPGETWRIVEKALVLGRRDLPGGSSLAKLFDKHRPQWHSGRGLWHAKRSEPLTVEQILQWADEYYTQHGRRPVHYSGPIPSSSDSWATISEALSFGRRGLPVGSSLAQFLNQHRPQWLLGGTLPRRRKSRA